VKKVFLVHGEPDAQDEFKAKLQGLGYIEVKTPEMGESFEM
jgi:Cft2 family RNA processing exonuclease